MTWLRRLRRLASRLSQTAASRQVQDQWAAHYRAMKRAQNVLPNDAAIAHEVQRAEAAMGATQR